MKRKNLNSKLVLNKQTITNLNMNEVKGGTVTITDTVTVTIGCNTAECASEMKHCIIQEY